MPGVGKGYVDIFTLMGVLVKRLNHGPWMNAPWAVVMAPADFGKFGNKFLVGNFGSGRISQHSKMEGSSTGSCGGKKERQSR